MEFFYLRHIYNTALNKKGEINLNNTIYVRLINKNRAVLQFPKFKIKTIAFIGKNGLTKNKKEGDNKTPIGEFELGIAMGMHPMKDFEEPVKICYKQITENMYWVDDSNSKYYNQLIDVSKVKKSWKSAEHLIEYPVSYEYLIEIKINPCNIPGKGSAIFLHCIDKGSTSGCIAVNRGTMIKILKNVNKSTKIRIHQ